jgi:hypothetical protein
MVDYLMRVTGMDVFPDYEGRKDVVHCARWEISASDGSKSFTYQSKTSIPYNPASPWQDFAHLTEDEVLGWISLNVPNEIAAARKSLSLNFPDDVPSEGKPLPWE